MLTSLRTQLLNSLVKMAAVSIAKRNATAVSDKPAEIMRNITLNEQNICYLEVGNGAPVVLLHGLGASALSWVFTLPALAAQRRAIAIDQVGHGRSDKPAIPYRITDFVHYLERLLEELQLKQVDLVGNSMGGWIAARLAIKRPDLVRRLVLVCSAGLIPSPAMAARLQQINFAPRSFADTRAMLNACFYDKTRYVNSRSITISYLIRHLEANHNTVAAILRNISDPNEWLDEQLPQIAAPTLVLWGREDELLPVEFADRFAQAIPNAQLEIFSQCGHVPQIERAADFNKLLKDFLY